MEYKLYDEQALRWLPGLHYALEDGVYTARV